MADQITTTKRFRFPSVSRFRSCSPLFANALQRVSGSSAKTWSERLVLVLEHEVLDTQYLILVMKNCSATAFSNFTGRISQCGTTVSADVCGLTFTLGLMEKYGFMLFFLKTKIFRRKMVRTKFVAYEILHLLD